MSFKDLIEKNIIKCLKRWYFLHGFDAQSQESLERFKYQFPEIQVWHSYFLMDDGCGNYNINDQYKSTIDIWIHEKNE